MTRNPYFSPDTFTEANSREAPVQMPHCLRTFTFYAHRQPRHPESQIQTIWRMFLPALYENSHLAMRNPYSGLETFPETDPNVRTDLGHSQLRIIQIPCIRSHQSSKPINNLSLLLNWFYAPRTPFLTRHSPRSRIVCRYQPGTFIIHSLAENPAFASNQPR